MQGRTNVKDGISLNANVVSKVVDTGANVVAGNFVEYKTIATIVNFAENLSTSSVLNRNLINISGNVFVGIFRSGTSINDVKLVKIENDEITILDSYFPTTDTRDLYVSGNVVYIACAKVIIRVEIQNNRFVFIDSLDLTTPASLVSGSSINRIALIGNYLYCITAYSSSTYNAILVDTSSTLAYVKKFSFSPTGSVSGEIMIKTYEDYLIALIPSYTGSGGYATKYKINYDACVVDKTVTTVSSASPIANNAFWLGENVISFMNGSKLNFWYIDFGALSSRYITTSISLPLQDQNFFVNMSERDIFVFCAKSSNYNSKVFILRLNENEMYLEKITDDVASFYVEGTYYYSSCPIVYENNVFVFGMNSNREAKYERLTKNSANTELTKSQDVSYVKNWTGIGQPIGVAKQSGTAGDTIEVYIPTV